MNSQGTPVRRGFYLLRIAGAGSYRSIIKAGMCVCLAHSVTDTYKRVVVDGDLGAMIDAINEARRLAALEG